MIAWRFYFIDYIIATRLGFAHSYAQIYNYLVLNSFYMGVRAPWHKKLIKHLQVDLSVTFLAVFRTAFGCVDHR